MIFRRCVMLLVVMMTSISARAEDFVTRRGSDQGLSGSITNIDDSGVTIRSASGAEHSITWDRVRDVATSDPSIQRKVDEFRDTAENLWRARTRLERGDTVLAEPIFERLFAEYRGRRTHETALIVAEGLLRCRLARAANDTAIIPALEVMRISRKGVTTDAFRLLADVVDEATGLCPQLPPVWVPSGALARTEVELKSYDAGGDTAVAAVAALYRAAIRQQLQLSEEPLPTIAQDHPGVTLLRAMIETGLASAEQRDKARNALIDRLAQWPGWAQAWARMLIGLSILNESRTGGTGHQEQALVHLSHLPALHARTQPYLTAMALAIMSEELRRMGQAEHSTTLRNELLRLFPGHPAISLLDAQAAGGKADEDGLPNATLPAEEPV